MEINALPLIFAFSLTTHHWIAATRMPRSGRRGFFGPLGRTLSDQKYMVLLLLRTAARLRTKSRLSRFSPGETTPAN